MNQYGTMTYEQETMALVDADLANARALAAEENAAYLYRKLEELGTLIDGIEEIHAFGNPDELFGCIEQFLGHCKSDDFWPLLFGDEPDGGVAIDPRS